MTKKRTGIMNITVLLCGATLASGQTWKPLQNQYPGNGAGPCLLLTDGTVACNNSQSNTNQWYRLTPDSSGDYVKGTWALMPKMPYQPIFYASAVLPDGKLLIQGGEYLNGMASWTNQGAVFDPIANAWTSVICNVVPSGQLGNSQSVILPNGTFMIANTTTKELALITSAKQAQMTGPTGCAALNNCYTLETPSGKADINFQEEWTLLPNGDVLVVNNIASPDSQTYTQGTPGTWTGRGPTGNCSLPDKGSREEGPQVLRPDGTVVVFGANSVGACVEIYDSSSNTWTDPNVSFPSGLDVAPGPAALLPNDNVLVMASPGVYSGPSTFFEFTAATATLPNALIQVNAPPNAVNDASFEGHMVILPTGDILFTDYSTDVEIGIGSTFPGLPDKKKQPAIGTIKVIDKVSPLVIPGHTHEVTGLRFNGMSQGAAFGNELQTATNYPLVRATQLFGSGNVTYWKTHDHSTMGVATGDTPVSTQFDVPADTLPGLYSVVVVANGIASDPKIVTVGCELQSSVEIKTCDGQ